MMRIEPGQLLSHYRLVEKIGEGGMGEVYLAQDTTLKRKVALKLLPAAKASDPARLARFQREAEAVAALNHPNIVTIYSVEQADDVRFLTMELVEGESLDRLLDRGALPVERLLDIGVALADALSAAHERGIVHRDLKTANVMVTPDGRIKVLDFGLAKLAAERASPVPQEPSPAAEESSATLTAGGTVLGTVPYMSPEQLRDRPLDHRTDIFSLGVLLYEMAAGRRPFQGSSPAAVVTSILIEKPPPVTQSRPDLPRQLPHIISHCLEKEPAARFQTARDVCDELRALRRELETRAAGRSMGTARAHLPWRAAGPGARQLWPWAGAAAALVFLALFTALWLGRGVQAPTATTKEASIAVLPFVNMSGDEENEYFSDGLTEELLNALAKNPGLRVAARTSSFAFKGRSPEIAEVGAKLNVGTVLEGSVRKAGTRVRISAQLINVADGFHLWSETYDRTLEDILAVQEDIARAVAMELNVTLLAPPAAPSRPVNTDAFNLMLQARYFLQRRSQGDADKGVDLLQQALALDPDEARAWALLSLAYLLRANEGTIDVNEGYALARQATERALALDDTVAEAHVAMGRIKATYDWDWTGADAEYQRALELEPGNAIVLRAAGLQAATLGRLDEAIALTRRSVQLDPLSVASYGTLGYMLWYAGRLEEAATVREKVLELNPQRLSGHTYLGLVYLSQGRPHAALEEMLREGDEMWRLYGLALAHHALGRTVEADAALAELIENFQDSSAFQIAEIFAYRQEVDRAFEWLERAYARRDGGLVNLKGDPLLKSLVGDRRWQPFLEKMGLAG